MSKAKEIIEAINKMIEGKEDFCSKQFGDILFGSFKEFYKKEKEKDTPTEKKVFKYITDFIRGEQVGKEKDAAFIKALDTLKKCKKEYPEVLKSKSLSLYRGLALKNNIIKGIEWKKNTVPMMVMGNKIPYMVAEYTYKGRSVVQSWSPTFEIARMFAIQTSTLSECEIILKHDFSQKDLLFNIKFTNKLSQKIMSADEDEIVRIGNKPIKCVLYLSEFVLNQLRLEKKI